MDCFYKFDGFKRLVLFSILCTFTLAVLAPPPVYAQINLGDVGFGIKVQKLIDKVWRYYNKSDSDGLLSTILELKTEVETHTGKKIDVSKEIDKIESELKKKGGKPPKDIFKKFKDLVKKKEKKNHHRVVCMGTYFHDQPNMSFEDYEFLIRAAKKTDQAAQQNEPLPLKFVLGVTLLLGGAFVMLATPICPPLAYAGEMMVSTGFGMLLDQGLDVYQKQW